jgi:1,4-alpha-glucan branching enzyme
VVEWFTDPFALSTDVGELGAFDFPDLSDSFAWGDKAFKVPEIDDLVVYELQVEEFNVTFDGVIERIAYLKSLGVNTLELMPVTSPKLDFDWGYGPLHYFAPNERCGGVQGLKRLVNACHLNGIAVILDVVYQHVAPEFAYKQLYQATGKESPMIGQDGDFGPKADFTKPFTLQYFLAANYHWLREYHVDGFRYDNVAGFYNNNPLKDYGTLVYQTYTLSQSFERFQGTENYSRLIQCAEDLDNPRGIIHDTYSNSTWQDGLLNKVADMAKNNYVDADFAHLLDTRFSGYPDFNTIPMAVAPFQYLESHDHDRLIAAVGLEPSNVPGDVRFGDRSKFYKLQPYAIALYTCQGIPMLWQGQEIAENYTLPGAGNARIGFKREVHWEHFYDIAGGSLIRLYRILGALRRDYRALRSRASYYYFSDSRPSDGVIAYHRHAPASGQELEQGAMVFLNFSDFDRELEVPFPLVGTYREMIDAGQHLFEGNPPNEIQVQAVGERKKVVVPSNYGYIFIMK